MLARPVGDEFAEGRIEPLLTEDILAQQRKPERRLEVGDGMPILLANSVCAA